MNELQINVSFRPETPQKPAKIMCAIDVYTMSPFLHIFLQGFVRKLFVCKMCAKKMYNLSHIFSSGEEGLTGDFPPAQTRARGVRGTLTWLRNGNGRGARAFRLEAVSLEPRPKDWR